MASINPRKGLLRGGIKCFQEQEKEMIPHHYDAEKLSGNLATSPDASESFD